MGMDLDLIKVICCDVDGSLTDGTYEINELGIISKIFHTRDFYALNKMMQLGYQVIILTSASDKVIERKCENFDFLLYTGVENKQEEMARILKSMNLKWENLGYIGDAENDLDVMQNAGWTACPLDAIPEVVEFSNYQSVHNGGHGAVYDSLRKFCDYQSIDW